VSTKPTDDLDAVRIIADALQAFDPKSQERIIRWAREKLGLPTAGSTGASPPVGAGGIAAAATPFQPGSQDTGRTTSIKDFIAAKNPRSDNQLAATVAYYYQFEAPEGQRKTAISAADLLEATRLAGRDRLPNPGKTLGNAHDVGLLDRGSERGSFSVNAVGENLVAMTLPGGATATAKKRKKSGGRKRPSNRTAARRSTKLRSKK
jgi:hypothetical protein